MVENLRGQLSRPQHHDMQVWVVPGGGAVVCVLGYLAASLASTPQTPGAPQTFLLGRQPKMFPAVPHVAGGRGGRQNQPCSGTPGLDEVIPVSAH